MPMVYSCPHCRGVLNPDATIILIGRHGEDRALMGFHPQPGNYRISLPPGFEIEPGSKWSFHCPLCRESLVAEIAPEFCCLDMVSRDMRHRVFFSRTAGDHATFVITAEGVEPYGEHADRHSLEILGQV